MVEAMAKPVVVWGAAPNAFERGDFEELKVVGGLLKGLVDPPFAFGPVGAPNGFAVGGFLEFSDDIPKTPKFEAVGCDGAPNGFGEAVPFCGPEGIPKMLVVAFCCDATPKELLVVLCGAKGFEFVVAFCFGAKGLNVPFVSGGAGETFKFALALALLPNGFEGA